MRAIKIILGTILCFSIAGCGKQKTTVTFNTQKKAEKATRQQKKQIKKIEAKRIATDAAAWQILTDDYNNVKEEYESDKDKSIALLLDYYTGIYKIAYSRVQNDSEYAGAYDDGYLEYLALLQTYCEYYESGIQDFYDQLNSGDANVMSSGIFAAEKSIETLYNCYLNGESLNTGDSNSSESKKKSNKKNKNKKNADKKDKSKKGSKSKNS